MDESQSFPHCWEGAIDRQPRVGAGGMKALSQGGAGKGAWLCHTGPREPSCLLGSICHGPLGPLRISAARSAVRN